MIEGLIKQMTLKEKVGQLNQRLYGWQIYEKRQGQLVLTDYFKEEVARYDSLGWIYGVFRADPWSSKNLVTGLTTEEARQLSQMIQDYVKKQTRLAIPVLLSEECPHGHQGLESTTLPVNFSTGASWNPQLYGKVQGVVAQEIRAKGAHVGLVSVLDVVRDPRWGRTEECFSEDPLLTSCFARAAVLGLQGTNPQRISEQNVLAVLKHFAAQGSSMGGHNAGPVNIGYQELRDIHLPPMLAGIDAGALACMAAYNDIDGVPCHANPELLQHILRKEAGFSGLVMADGCALDRLADWLQDRAKAAALALSSGVDVSLWDNVFPYLEEAVARNILELGVLDQAVLRVLKVKESLGLFEEPTPVVPVPNLVDRQALTTQLAEESTVLLKNDGILPLNKTQKQKIAVIGPHSATLYHQLGDYTPFKQPDECTTLWQGFVNLEETAACFSHAAGCQITEGTPEQLAEAYQVACEADVILLTIGGSSIRDFSTAFDKNGAAITGSSEMTSGENIDLASLRLPKCQRELIQTLRSTKKPMIGIVVAGRPHSIVEIDDAFAAILWAGYPGQYGGTALANLLFGLATPSGKLAVSIPDSVGQLPVYYNYRNTAFQKDYTDLSGRPRYEFGYGLSYADLSLRDLHVQLVEDKIEINGQLTNQSLLEGADVIQVYLKNYTQTVLPRNKVLCGFEKIFVAPEQKATFQVTVTSADLQRLNLKVTDCFLLQVEVAGQVIQFQKEGAVVKALTKY